MKTMADMMFMLHFKGVPDEKLDELGGRLTGDVTVRTRQGKEMKLYCDETEWRIAEPGALEVDYSGLYADDEKLSREEQYALAERTDFAGASLKGVYIDEDTINEEFDGVMPEYRLGRFEICNDEMRRIMSEITLLPGEGAIRVKDGGEMPSARLKAILDSYHTEEALWSDTGLAEKDGIHYKDSVMKYGALSPNYFYSELITRSMLKTGCFNINGTPSYEAETDRDVRVTSTIPLRAGARLLDIKRDSDGRYYTKNADGMYAEIRMDEAKLNGELSKAYGRDVDIATITEYEENSLADELATGSMKKEDFPMDITGRTEGDIGEFAERLDDKAADGKITEELKKDPHVTMALTPKPKARKSKEKEGR